MLSSEVIHEWPETGRIDGPHLQTALTVSLEEVGSTCISPSKSQNTLNDRSDPGAPSIHNGRRAKSLPLRRNERGISAGLSNVLAC